MTREDVLDILRAAEPDLRAFGIGRLSLFGSFARDEAGPDSDVDLVYAWDGGGSARVDAFEAYFDALSLLEALLARPVHFAPESRLHPMVRDDVVASAMVVFPKREQRDRPARLQARFRA
jgi:uncharacterized protein